MKQSQELELQAALQAAALMAAAARTSPKTRGIDNIQVLAIEDAENRQKLIDKMRQIAEAENRPGFSRDANCVAASAVVLAIGVESNPANLNCGYCGKDKCQLLADTNGVCAFNSIDLGIASCSAAAVAANLNIDNRLMFSIGRACLDLQWFTPRVGQALGIPLSVTGKSPFFDRR